MSSSDAFSSPERKTRKHGDVKSEKVSLWLEQTDKDVDDDRASSSSEKGGLEEEYDGSDEQEAVKVAGTSVSSNSTVNSCSSNDTEVVGGTKTRSSVVKFYDVILLSKNNTHQQTQPKRNQNDRLSRNLSYDFAIFPNDLETFYTIEPPLSSLGLFLGQLDHSNFTTFQEEQCALLELACKYMFEDKKKDKDFAGFKEYCDKEDQKNMYDSVVLWFWKNYICHITDAFDCEITSSDGRMGMSSGGGRMAIYYMLDAANYILRDKIKRLDLMNLGGAARHWANLYALEYNTSKDTRLEAVKKELLQFPTLPVSKEELLKKGFEHYMYVPAGYLASREEKKKLIIISDISVAYEGGGSVQRVFEQTWLQALRGLSDREAEAANTVYGFSMSVKQGTLIRITRTPNNVIETHYAVFPFYRNVGKTSGTSAGKIMVENFLILQNSILSIIQKEASK